MRNIGIILVLLGVAACDQSGGGAPIDAREFLSKLEGPKVPTVQDTMLENARSAEAQGEWGTAGQLYQQLLADNPGDAGMLASLAECYRRIGDYDKAIGAYDAALAKDSNLLAAKEGKALSLISKGDFDTPAGLLDDVMKVDSKRWKTLNALGILFTTRNMHAESQSYFKEALKYSPGNTSVMNNMGLSQALNKEYDAAADTLLQAGALSAANGKDRKRIDLNLALVYAVAGKLEDARMVTENYYNGAALNNNMGFYAHLSNDNALAKDYLNMALTDSTSFYEKAWQNLQDINSSAGKQPPAVDLLKKTDAQKTAPGKEPAAEIKTEKPVKSKSAKKAKPAPVSEDHENMVKIIGAGAE